MLQLKLFMFIGATLIAILMFAIGVAVGAVYSGNDFNSILMPFLSMAGTWASGVGAFLVVVATIQIATAQAQEYRLQGSIRCAHHSIMVVEELLSRVFHQKRLLIDGGVPMASLRINTEVMQRRHEDLHHRENYLYFSGSVLNLMNNLKVRFHNQAVMTEFIQSKLPNSMDMEIPANLESAKPLCLELDKFAKELEELKEELYKLRLNFPKYWNF